MQDTTLLLLSLAVIISIVIVIFVPEEKGGGGSWIEGLAILFAVLFMNCVMATHEYQQESQFLNRNKLKGGTKFLFSNFSFFLIVVHKVESVLFHLFCRKFMRVIRGGRKQEVETSEIFVGDIVIVDCGDIIPADGIVIQASHLTVDESVMTGKPVSLPKSPEGDYLMLSGCQVFYFCIFSPYNWVQCFIFLVLFWKRAYVSGSYWRTISMGNYFEAFRL